MAEGLYTVGVIARVTQVQRFGTGLQLVLACESRASALRYAECLATVAERALLHRNAIAPALMHGRRQVSARVERLINWKEGSHTMGRASLLIALAVSVTALFFARVELPLLFPKGDGAAPAHGRTFIESDHDGDSSLVARGAQSSRVS